MVNLVVWLNPVNEKTMASPRNNNFFEYLMILLVDEAMVSYSWGRQGGILSEADKVEGEADRREGRSMLGQPI